MTQDRELPGDQAEEPQAAELGIPYQYDSSTIISKNTHIGERGRGR